MIREIYGPAFISPGLFSPRGSAPLDNKAFLTPPHQFLLVVAAPHNLHSFTVFSVGRQALDAFKVNACFYEDGAVVSKEVASSDLLDVVLFVVFFQSLFS